MTCFDAATKGPAGLRSTKKREQQSDSRIFFLVYPLSQSKRGDTGIAVVKGRYDAFGRSIQPLDSQCDSSVSRKPEFKEAVSHRGNSPIDQDISILVYSFYIKLFLGQLRLTGGQIMDGSRMRLTYIRRYGDQHFVFGKWNFFNCIVRKFKHRGVT